MDGLREFTTFLGKVETELKDAKWLFKATEFVEDEAKKRVPVETGALKETITHEVRQTEGGMTGIVEASGHAIYVELGTGPKGANSDHSKVSPYIPLQYKGTGWTVHQSQVPSFTHFDPNDDSEFFNITGQPAQPFLYPALKDNEQRIIEIANKGINEVLKDD